MHATVHSGKHIHTYIHRTYIYNKKYIHTPILYVLIRLLDTRENEVLLISRHVVDKIKPLAFRCTYVRTYVCMYVSMYHRYRNSFTL